MTINLVTSKHAPESARFYTPQGQVILEIPMTSKDGMRAPNIGDGRKMGLYPSVTTIKGDILRAEGLERWKQSHLIECVIENPPPPRDESNEAALKAWEAETTEWTSDIFEAAAEYGSLCAERGSEIHEMIAQYFTRGIVPVDEAGARACREIESHWQGRKIECEVGFGHESGFAGTIDLVIDEGEELGDTKTKEIKKFKKPIFDMGLQLGGYREHYIKKDPKLVQVIVDRETGKTQFFTWGDKWKRTQSQQPQELTDAFHLLFGLWKIIYYDPTTWEAGKGCV